jgi:hypothetical protein
MGLDFVESMTSVAPNRLASSSRFAWMSMTTILEAPAMHGQRYQRPRSRTRDRAR